MKTVCILNLIALALVFTCNFDLSDLPYFRGLVQNMYDNIVGLIFKNAGVLKHHSLHHEIVI
jgi:hypothetical protein